jgi:hypothetical protein
MEKHIGNKIQVLRRALENGFQHQTIEQRLELARMPPVLHWRLIDG